MLGHEFTSRAAIFLAAPRFCMWVRLGFLFGGSLLAESAGIRSGASISVSSGLTFDIMF